MTEEEIKAMQEENQKLKDQLTEKDERITDLEEITKNQKSNFRRLKDMTTAEKEALTAEKREELERSEAIASEIDSLKAKLAEKETKETESKRAKYVSMFATTEEEKAKIMENYSRLADPEDSDDAIFRKVKDSVVLAGITLPEDDSIMRAHNDEGMPAGGGASRGFADTPEAQSLADKMGLPKPPEKQA